MRGSWWARLVLVAGLVGLAFPAAAATVFSDNMSGGVNGWTASGLWHQTTRRSSSTTTSWWYGQEATLTYDTGATNSGTLDSPVVSLVGYTSGQGAFQAWWQTEGISSFDVRQVYAKATDTTTWTLLWTAPAANQMAFSSVTVSLSAYNGRQFQLRFKFDTVDGIGNGFEGWYVDDVQVTGNTADTTPPAPPTGLGVAGGGTDGAGVFLNLAWAANSESDLKDYRIYRSTNVGVTLVSSQVVAAVLAPGTTHRDRGLGNGATFYYRATSRDQNLNESGGSSEVSGMYRDAVAPAGPLGLGAADVAGDQGGTLRVTWTANTEADLKDYGIYRGTWTPLSASPGTLRTRVASPGTTHQEAGLVTGATYYYRLIARDVFLNESSESGEVSAVPLDNLAPGPPAGVGVTDPGTGALNLSWTAGTESDLKDYRLYRSTNAGVTLVSSHAVTAILAPGTTHQDGGLTQGLRWYFRLTARDANLNESAGSGEVSGVPGAPAPPSGLAAAAGGSDAAGVYLSLAWAANTEADLKDYRVYRSTNSGVTMVSSHAAGVILAPGTTHRDRGLINGTTYYYQLTARDASLNESGGSTEASGVFQDTAGPAPPEGLNAADVPVDQGGAVRLAWTANTEADLRDYGIYRATWGGAAPEPSRLAARMAAAGTTHQDTGLTNAVTYYYQVTARDGSLNESGGSVEVPVVSYDNIPPGTPALGLADTGAAWLMLSWTANLESDLRDYRIYRSTNAGVTLVSSHAAVVILAPGTTHQEDGLTPGVGYHYRLTARDANLNESPPSVEVSGAAGVPAAPAGLGAVSGGSDASWIYLNLTWVANTEGDLRDYRLFRSSVSGVTLVSSQVVATVLVPGTTHRDRGLADGVTAYYRLTARDGALNQSSGSSEFGLAYHDPVPPSPPVGFAVEDVPIDQGGRLRMSWTANSEPDFRDYGLYRSTGTPVVVGPGTLVTRITSPGTTHQDAGLTFSATYYYRVTARDLSQNESGGSTEGSAVPSDDLAPPAPAGLGAASAESGMFGLSLNLTWVASAAGDLKDYRLWRSTNPGVTLVSSHTVAMVLAPGTTYQDTGLSSVVLYYYRVTARDIAGNASASSAELSVNPAALLPAPIVPLFTDNIENGTNGWAATGLWHQTTRRAASATHSWWYGQEATVNYNTGVTNSGTLDSSVMSLVGYTSGQVTFQAWWQTEGSSFYDARQVYAKATDTTTWTLLWTAPGASQMTFSSVTVSLSVYNGRQFQLRFKFDTVDSVANAYEGWYVDDVQLLAVATDSAPPAVPVSLVVSSSSAGQLNVSWGANTESDLKDYGVYRGLATGPLSGKARLVWVAKPTVAYQNGGLEVGRSYYYQVTARDVSSNESAGSAEASGTPSDVIEPGQGATITSADSPGTRVIVPAGVFPVAVRIRIRNQPEWVYPAIWEEADAAESAAAGFARLDPALADTIREIRAVDLAGSARQPAGELTLVVPYARARIRAVDEPRLRIFRLNEDSRRWELAAVPERQTVDVTNATVSSPVNHLSVFRIAVWRGPELSLEGTRVFPNPVTFASAARRTVKFDRLTTRATVRIYTLSGDLVREILPGTPLGPDGTANVGNGVCEWSGKNSEGEAVARGTYVVLITDDKGGRVVKTLAVLK